MSLFGTRCPDCGRIVFRAQPPCPLCGSARAIVVELAHEGAVETFTTIGERIIGEIRLSDGTLVMGRIETSEPRVGDAVVLDGAGSEVVFVPA